MQLPPWGLFTAVQFLTRVPIRLTSAPDLTRSVPWFPVVGAGVGAIVGGAAAGLSEWLPSTVAATVAVLLGVLLTGAFHEDGLADTCDALGGWTPQRRREILKDSRHGSYGVAAMTGTMLLRVVALASLGPAAAFAGSIAAHALGRGAAVAVMGVARPVPTEGLGADYSRGLSLTRASVGALGSLALAIIVVGWWTVPLGCAVAIGAVLVAWGTTRAFGGVSGDVLGAVEQVGECIVLVTVSGLAAHHAPWWT